MPVTSSVPHKAKIRDKIKKQRQQLTTTFIDQAAHQIAQLWLKSEFAQRVNIAFYLPQDGEADPRPLLYSAASPKKQLYLPVLSPNDEKTLLFYSYQFGDRLRKNRYGIDEPDTHTQKAVACQALDAIILPLVGFDIAGNRLGRGAGCYDYTLAFTKTSRPENRPQLIGLGYEFQKIPAIECDIWDVPLDCIITEHTIYRRR